jgi:outer membrane lipoprotein-sorting protein
MGKGSSRYSIEDAGLKRGSLRTFKAWQTKREAGELIFDYRGKVKLPELGNRECFAIHRTIKGLEVDNFRLNDDTVRNPAKHPKEAFTAVTIYLDCETWLQVGSQLWKADGTLYASYFFRDIEINPAFGPDDFTKKALE